MSTSRPIAVLSALVLGQAWMFGAQAQNIYYAVRTTTTYGMDGAQDLGLTDSDTHSHFQLDLVPRALITFSPAWTGYLRARVFLPTARAEPVDFDQPNSSRASHGFAGLDEFWIQYNGLTSYPGEGFRLGRQRIRQSDGEWWDQDAEALRWMLDTTLHSAGIGIAHPFSSYRTDGAEVPLAQRDRTYLFAHFDSRWSVQDRVGLRVTHALDDGGAPEIGSPVLADAKLQNAQLTWIGVYADNGFHDIRGSEQRFSYSLDATYLSGHQTVAARDSTGIVATRLSQSVSAWKGSAGARWRLLAELPLHVGAAYTYSQGGENAGQSHQYQQTGMQSNASHFSGTQTLINRYNAMLQPELGNLSIATGFVSLDLPNNSASLIFEQFRKDDGDSPVLTQNVSAVTANNSSDLGRGVDLVLAHYFSRAQRTQEFSSSGDAFATQGRRSLISLRASLFQPGEAYGPAADTVYRMLLELTLWWD